MKRYKLDLSNNPSFNTVIGLTNRTFDGSTIVQGRGATEDQLLVVYNKIKEVADFLEESGCSDDPFDLIKRQLDELEQAQAQCCGTDWSADVTQSMFERMADLEDRIQTCCTVDHGAVDIQNILDRIDALEQQVISCCNELDTRVQNVVNNLRVYEKDENVGRRTDTGPAPGTTCDQNAVLVSYTLDLSGAWVGGVDQPKVVGQVNANVVDPNISIDRYYFTVKTSDDVPFARANPSPGLRTFVPRIRIAGHREILFQIHPLGGFISMMAHNGQFSSGVTDAEDSVPTTSYVDCCENPIVGSGKIYTKVFVAAIGTNGCVWETEIPLSDFDFSDIDESQLISSDYCPCQRSYQS